MARATTFVEFGFTLSSIDRLQTAFHENQAALLEIFAADLAEASPGFDIDPLGVFLGIAFLALPAITDGDAELSYLLPGGGELAGSSKRL
jgi:hypothetical protein